MSVTRSENEFIPLSAFSSPVTAGTYPTPKRKAPEQSKSFARASRDAGEWPRQRRGHSTQHEYSLLLSGGPPPEGAEGSMDSLRIDDETLLSAKEVATLLGVSDRTVRKWAEGRELPAKKLGRKLWRFSKRQILEWLKKR